jgi:non-ribosomal peptide synthetase-like protein
MPIYLRMFGARVGRDVWVETLTTTEFDLASFGDGCAVNRNSVVETHLFHDRLMSTGHVHIGAGATLGPSSVTLPETVIGDATVVGGRAIVMRGEELPAGTRWHGAPVVVE